MTQKHYGMIFVCVCIWFFVVFAVSKRTTNDGLDESINSLAISAFEYGYECSERGTSKDVCLARIGKVLTE